MAASSIYYHDGRRNNVLHNNNAVFVYSGNHNARQRQVYTKKKVLDMGVTLYLSYHLP